MVKADASRRERVERMYAAFNARDLAALGSFVADDVDWPDGDRRLNGRSAVEAFWSRKWRRENIQDEVTDVIDLGPDAIAVHISQVVRSLEGQVISRGRFEQVFEFRSGLVARMDSRPLCPTNDTQDLAAERKIIEAMYDGFNQRDIPAVLSHLDEDVAWANGVEGGHEHGRDAVRAYWTRQWATIQARVTPRSMCRREDGALAVEVHQVVRDVKGELLLDEEVRHVFRIENGLVTRFDIENAGGLSSLPHD